MTAPIAPISKTKRIDIVDILRGFALFGILMVNMTVMYHPYTSILIDNTETLSTINLYVRYFIQFFFESKFYVIFSFLFGYGAWIFLNNKGTDLTLTVPLFKRRLFFLFLFGLIHVSLLWPGDILIFYALMGFLILVFKKSSDRKLWVYSITFTVLPMLLFLLLFGLIAMAPASQQAEINGALLDDSVNSSFVSKANLIYTTGNFFDLIAIRWQDWAIVTLPGAILFFYPISIGMFLLGFLASRKQVLSKVSQNRSLLKKIMIWGLVIGLIFNGLKHHLLYGSDMIQDNPYLNFLALSLISVNIALSFFYMAGITLWYDKNGNRFLTHLAPFGKMAFTNYISHSIIALLLFQSPGLALMGKVQEWQGVLLTFLIISIQIIFSNWWLKNYRFGPLEWLWRSLTYGKKQDFRRPVLT